MTPDYLWKFLIPGYLFTIAIETPILLVGLSARHSWGVRIFSGFWLTACTYPIVVLVLPNVFDIRTERGLYLWVAEIFAPAAECTLFWLAFGRAGVSSKPSSSSDAALKTSEQASSDSPTSAIKTERGSNTTGTTLPVGHNHLPDESSNPYALPTTASTWRDMITIILANLASFLGGEVVYWMGWF